MISSQACWDENVSYFYINTSRALLKFFAGSSRSAFKGMYPGHDTLSLSLNHIPARMPISAAHLICSGMAGVYDIGKHYQYEAARGVHFLSTMARAIGGAARFASQSPAAILARAAARSSGPKESEPAAQ